MLEAAIANFRADLWLYLSMPFTSGIIGYVTNVIAIKMMFYPVEFFGIKAPYLGWQGIIPRKAGKMAAIATDSIVPRLVSEKEIFERLDPVRVAAEIEKPIIALVDQLVDEIMHEYEPTLWQTLPQGLRDIVVRRVQRDAPSVVAQVMRELSDNVSNMFDLKDMVVSTLMRDKALMNTMFQETGRKEFRFIGNSGFYFGFLFGIGQMIGWMFYQANWQLPVFGLVVGYATNWIALKMIFRPIHPVRVGPMVLQGLFFKRQKEVSRDFGKLVADEIVTPSHIIEAVLKGPHADRMFDMIGKHVQRTIDEQSGIARPFVIWTIGSRRYAQMKALAVQRLVRHLPAAVAHVDDYAKETMDIARVLSERMGVLPPPEFESMLRPAFQEDEWILIAVGAVLGFLVGLGQVLLFAWFGSVSTAGSVETVSALLHALS